jgi:hypothetical protein
LGKKKLSETEVIGMSPQLVAVLLAFLQKEATANPMLAGNFLKHILDQKKVDPNIEAIVIEAVDTFLPIVLQSIKL